MTFSPLVLMVHCCSKMLHLVAFARQGVLYCCTQGNNVVAPCVQQVKGIFPSKNNKLLFLLYLIFKDLTANIKKLGTSRFNRAFLRVKVHVSDRGAARP